MSKELNRAWAKDGWRTPDTYTSSEYACIPDAPGVYLLECFEWEGIDVNHRGIAYVGQAKSLTRRLDHGTHDVLRKLWKDGLIVCRWFKTFPIDELRDTERRFIHLYDPPYNIIGRKRGFSNQASVSVV